jgi:hypothetical protein
VRSDLRLIRLIDTPTTGTALAHCQTLAQRICNLKVTHTHNVLYSRFIVSP